MGNVEIVIKIPEDTYKDIIKNGFIYDEDNEVITHAIKNNTPLPKGHGRLGDLDALEIEMENGIRAGNYEEGYETFAHINNMDDCVDCVRYADTIINADTAESEE